MAKTKEFTPLTCTPVSLPAEHAIAAADAARRENPANHPPVEAMAMLSTRHEAPTRLEIAVATAKYWRTNGVRLTVGFLDNPPLDLRAKILSHMNAWGRSANVQFTETATDPQVRIARGNGGYWSYLGTDILLIDKTAPTMNLQAFTMNTPDSEFYRVVRHETGHTLGCPHEHMRGDLVALIDEAKAIAYYGASEGWTPDQVRAQVLTPLDPSTIWGTAGSDRLSIMCYQIPGNLTKDGKPILGGTDIDQLDYDFMAQVYPKAVAGQAASGSTGRFSADPADGWPSDAPPSSHKVQQHAGHGCAIDVMLHGGNRLSVPAEASEEQIRRVIAAMVWG